MKYLSNPVSPVNLEAEVKRVWRIYMDLPTDDAFLDEYYSEHDPRDDADRNYP